MTELNGKVIFSLHETKTGAELWSTNGSVAGTLLVKDINTRATQGSWANFSYKGASINDGIVFVAYEKQHGDELYASNGTQAGTKLINDILPGENPSRPRDFLSKNNYAYFIGFPTADGTTATIYRTNGQSNGLKAIFSYNSYPYSDGYYRVADNGLVFTVVFNWNTYNYELWRSDGTATGSYVVASNLYYNHSMVTSGNIAFFVAGDLAAGYELWKSDGTVAGTKIVKDIVPGDIGSYPYSLFSYNGSVYFGASDENYIPGFWKSDGTAAGTIKLANVIVPLTFNNDGLNQFEAISGNTLYFNAFSTDTYQSGLWETNGTIAGTQLVSTVVSSPFYLTDVKGTLFFAGYDQNGLGLWKSNGNAGNTKPVKNTNYNPPQYLTSAGGKLYFTLSDVLWSSDGTDAGTQPVDDPLLSRLNSITNLIGTDNKLFFSAYSYQYGFELFVGNASSSSPNIQSVNRQDLPEQVQQVFKIYPSPAKNVLNINYYQQNAGRISLTVTDVNGKTLFNKNIEGTAGNQLIPLSVQTLPAGTYFLRLNGKTSLVKQFVKQD
jgi:ELWxxDGT repeat protein